MGIAERKHRELADRERKIIAAARLIAEREGWSAVTVRRLAEEIEYSQPVLYSHFENRNAVVAAVAIEGFREITAALQKAAPDRVDHRAALQAVAEAYLAFAREKPALYEAMFSLPNGLRFARADTRSELRAAFKALKAFVAGVNADLDDATETFWAALHGLAELERSGRIRQASRGARLVLLVDALLKASE